VLLATAVALSIVVVLVATPVTLVFALKKEKGKGWRGRMRVYWLFGLVRTTVHPGRTRRGRRSTRKSAVLNAGRRRKLYVLLRSEGFLRQLMLLLKNLLVTFRPRRFRLQWVIGFPDPADTGRLMGLIMPVQVFTGRVSFGRKSNLAVQVTPDFSGPCVKGQCHASVGFVPLKLFGLIFGFFLSPVVWRAIRASIREKNALAPSQRPS
jgi:hypothetical protein